MRALIIVDVQNDFLPGGALAVPGGDEVIPVINRLMADYDLIVATQDWHPAEHESFAAHHGRQVGDTIELHGLPQILWPVHCVQGTAGAAFAPQLDFGSVTRVFQKGDDPAVDSYSGFFDNGKRRDTGLGEFLRAEGVDEVHIAGLATDHCVKATAMDAAQLGFRTVVLQDACRGVELRRGDVQRAIREMEAAGVSVRNSGETPSRENEAFSAADADLPTEYDGRFLRVVNDNGWEYVVRRNATAVVVVVATHEGNILLVEQHRPPAKGSVLELPAGLVGDEEVTESLLTAAQRELLEETGYTAEQWTKLRACYSSPGMTNELLHYFWARSLSEHHGGGGVGEENITRHWAPLDQVERWLDQKEREGVYASNMVPAGIRLMLEQVMRGKLE